MIWILVLIGLLVAVVAATGALPFVPVIQVFTNLSNERMTEALNTTWAADTPLVPIVHLFSVWTIGIIVIALIIIVVAMSGRKG